LSAGCASYFQASSHFIKQDLMAHFSGIAPEQVEVIPEGVNAREFAAPVDAGALLKPYGLPERFLFCPAQLWPHKNHITILKALKKIETQHGIRIPLVLTGAPYSAASLIFNFVADESMTYVQYLGKVPFPALVALYQKAAFLITAVLYEAGSLPILEAAAAGTPVIASQTPPNEEVARVLALNLFAPRDVDQLASMILRLWNDEKTAASQVAHNRREIGFYSWENAARKYLKLFERIASA
jgi:glycosyltransferase involved in cell wall biosynthesis